LGATGPKLHRRTGAAGLVVALALFAGGVHAAGAPLTFDSSRAWEHLRQLVGFGPRPAGSAALAESRRYIEDQLKASGVSFAEQAWDDQTPAGQVHMVNVVATIPGARRERLVIAGHYDTKRFRAFRFVGANDGGSSAAFLVELARVLHARRNPLTIELLFLDGEEAVGEWEGTDHTYGSRHYVAEAKRTGSLSSLKALILVDMIADRDLRIKRDEYSTAWLTNLVWEAAAASGHAGSFTRESTRIEDDHLPFLHEGVPAVDIIDLDYPAWHTAADTLDAVSARSLQTVGDVLLAALPAIESKAAR
jgi:glutaminyl-peptide cyclotransferase